MPKRDLESQLTILDDWVHREFLSLDELLTASGCASNEVSGPGLVHRVDGVLIAQLHPKRHRLGVGLPDTMREDVHLSTGRLRKMRGDAWFDYSPTACDRETVEALIDLSFSRLQVDRPTAAITDVPPAAADGGVSDAHDLELLLGLVNAFVAHERATGAPTGRKVLREAIFFHWERPRLPRGGKRSLYLRHSPRAREQRARGDVSGLVYEHVLPISHVIRGLLDDPPTDAEALGVVLRAVPQAVLITKAEDALLNKAGMRDRVPEPEDPWSRYRAAGLQEAEFERLADETAA